MAGDCRFKIPVKTGSGSAVGRIVGIVLMIVGAVLLLVAVPRWFRTSVAAALLIGAGFLIRRFSG